MQLKIIYDNTTQSEEILAGWGFSCLIDGRILFDTGEEPRSIFHNLAQLNAEIAQIEAMVISHDHWDHTGGLWALLEQRPGLPVYACPGFSTEFKEKVRQLGGRLIENDGYTWLDQQIAVTGEIPGEYNGAPMPEQALVIQQPTGLVVITGCSHPGIINMLEQVQRDLPDSKISMVLGGFHLKDAEVPAIEAIVTAMEKMGVQQVGPTHCTGERAQQIFQAHFENKYISIYTGLILKL